MCVLGNSPLLCWAVRHPAALPALAAQHKFSTPSHSRSCAAVGWAAVGEKGRPGFSAAGPGRRRPQRPAPRAASPRHLQQAMPPTKIWMDCDAGVDDAQALMLVLAHPGAELVGVSCVHGNVGVHQVGRNIARVLTLCGHAGVPFYLGADEPLVAPAMDASFFHGQDGLGDVPDVFPASTDADVQPRPGHAAMHLAQAAQDHEGQLTVLATGPLTNIALAAKMDETLPSKVARLIVMGGAEKEGNVTPTAEYNFHCDSEAAHVVMRKFREVVLVSWECTLRHTLPSPWVEAWMRKPTPRAQFAAAVMAKSLEWERQRDAGAGWNACDALAAVLAVEPGALQLAEPRHCVVELQGVNTRGMSVLQRPNDRSGLSPNVLLVREVCMERYQRLMEAATD